MNVLLNYETYQSDQFSVNYDVIDDGSLCLFEFSVAMLQIDWNS